MAETVNKYNEEHQLVWYGCLRRMRGKIARTNFREEYSAGSEDKRLVVEKKRMEREMNDDTSQTEEHVMNRLDGKGLRKSEEFL